MEIRIDQHLFTNHESVDPDDAEIARCNWVDESFTSAQMLPKNFRSKHMDEISARPISVFDIHIYIYVRRYFPSLSGLVSIF